MWDHLGRHMTANVVGLETMWSAPVARFVARDGFGENVWLDESQDTVLATRLSGASVLQARGNRTGARSHRGANFLLQVKGTMSGFMADSWCEAAHIGLSPELLDRAAELAGQPKLSGRLRTDLVFPENQPYFDAMIRQYVWRAMDTRNPPTALEMESHILQILDWLIALHCTGRAPAKFRGGLTSLQLRRLADYVDAHLGEEIFIDTLSGIVDCGAKHFARAFRQATGVPPHRWLLQRRVERAQHLLKSSAASISEIALDTGFVDQSHLTSVFRKHTGMTPGAFRKHVGG